MFNSPLLDVTIGLVLVFMLYSLLVTSINEGLATIFSFRAMMLKKAIITGMLSNTPEGFFNGNKNGSHKLGKGVLKKEKTIGHLFYKHPIIKNYGSSRFFPIPSYITRSNFSTIIIDLLKKDFSDKLPSNNPNSPDIIKIGEILHHYKNNTNIHCTNPFLEAEPAEILYSFWKESNYNMEVFKQKLESWFDDMMNRVSGWYKRSTQFMLFFLGLLVAITFNVDTIKIASKLSKDKDAREKMVQLAIVAADKYKDDPRIKKIITKDEKVIVDTLSRDSTTRKLVFAEYKKQLDSIKNLLNGDIQNANQIIALGWNLDSLRKPISINVICEEHPYVFDSLLNIIETFNSLKLKDSITVPQFKSDSIRLAHLAKFLSESAPLKNKQDSINLYIILQYKVLEKRNALKQINQKGYKIFITNRIKQFVNDSLEKQLKGIDFEKSKIVNCSQISLLGERSYSKCEAFGYILCRTFTGTTFLGFLITAFAISLGAPFWFDLLNKLIKLRASGKKEESMSTSETTLSSLATAPAPQTTVNVNTQQTPGEEPVG